MEMLEVVNPPIIVTGGGGSYVPPVTIKPEIKPIIKKIKFDIKKAFTFLISQQKDDGSFGEEMYTDWAAISIASIKNENLKIQSFINLVRYLTKSKISEPSLTDIERHAIVLMSIGLNPYNINNENYIKKIIDSFDGKQFGDITQYNDDIFALIVLNNVGYTIEDQIIKDDIIFTIDKQKENGSWNDSIDMTSAGIIALTSFNQNEQFKQILLNARNFLKEKQQDNGGWNNVSSTSWAIGAILSLKEKPEDWIKNENSPLDFLGENQDTDGGIKNENLKNKIWETAYAITAFSGKTWNEIMYKFYKIDETEKIINENIIIEPNKEIKNKITKIEKTPIKIQNKIIDKVEKKIVTTNKTIENLDKNLNFEQRKTLRDNWFKTFFKLIFNF